MCRHGPADLHLKKVAGASSGVIPAVALLCNISIGKTKNFNLKFSIILRPNKLVIMCAIEMTNFHRENKEIFNVLVQCSTRD
jgi:hypothetical protein